MNPKVRKLPPWLPVVAVLLAALVLRLVLIQYRWVNPDEGAHLMDGLLASRGLIPGGDFGARQPLYVYVIALFVRVFGADYQWVRLFPVLATVGTGWFVYLIGRDLFDHETGVVAAILHLFLPFSVFLSLNTKTQMLTVFLSSAALYCVVKATRQDDAGANGALWSLVGAGALLALAYYVRQSSLAVLGTAFLVLFYLHRTEPRRLLRRTGYIVMGFSLVCVLCIGIFLMLGESSLGELLRRGDLNPLWFVVSTLRTSVETIGVRLSPGASMNALASVSGVAVDYGLAAASQTVGDQTLATAVGNIVDSVRLNGLLIVGAALSVFGLHQAAAGRSSERLGRLQIVLPFSWLLGVGLAYAYWTLQRGYFQAYFLEFLPPLSILTAAAATDNLRRIRGRPADAKDLGLIIILLAVFALIHAFAKTPMLSRSLYVTLTATMLAVFYLVTKADFRRWIRALAIVAGLTVAGVLVGPPLSGIVAGLFYLVLGVCVFGVLLTATPPNSGRLVHRGSAFVIYSLLVSSLVLTLVVSAARVNSTYLTSWSPDTVKQVAEFIRQTTPSRAEVLSGAVIWEFQADRRPYRNVSHPLSFRRGVFRGQRAKMREALAVAPPEVIVLDGYTEQTYLAAFPEIQSLLDLRYELVKVIHGSRFPVKIYRLLP